jgi:hypothetical protein
MEKWEVREKVCMTKTVWSLDVRDASLKRIGHGGIEYHGM